ncbi:hypothetical protein FSP39_020628 [Pinctada imbricata]|uniref:LEM-like domain-containing protein n=1 Tax=Pinctada imbricata TaxID=66713 RepID=A0AA88YEU3_PINIB|nr:hypothetical protein FSP39_020628 [Pinctada imbricata]
MSNFDPTFLTKAKLKEKLRRHNIQLPNSKAPKQEYIDLYVKHFQSVDDEPHFSSDDDFLAETQTEQYSNLEDSVEFVVDSEITFKKVDMITILF